MKWLSLPQRPWNFANIIGRAYAERYNCFSDGSDHALGSTPAASGPPQMVPSYAAVLSQPESLLGMLGSHCIDVRKLNDWQKATDFETAIEAALKNPADDFWKDFDISYPAFMRMRPWNSHLPQNLHFEFAKVINNIPLLSRPYLYYGQGQEEAEYTQHQLDGVDFDEKTETETGKKSDGNYASGYIAYWKKDYYAVKWKNFRQIYLNKGELKLKGTFKEKQIHRFRKLIQYARDEDSGYKAEWSDIDEFEVEVALPVDDPQGGELNIISPKVQSAIDEIYNLHDEKIDLAYIQHSTRGEKSFFLTKDNFVLPELNYWDKNAMPKNIKDKLL